MRKQGILIALITLILSVGIGYAQTSSSNQQMPMDHKDCACCKDNMKHDGKMSCKDDKGAMKCSKMDHAKGEKMACMGSKDDKGAMKCSKMDHAKGEKMACMGSKDDKGAMKCSKSCCKGHMDHADHDSHSGI